MVTAAIVLLPGKGSSEALKVTVRIIPCAVILRRQRTGRLRPCGSDTIRWNPASERRPAGAMHTITNERNNAYSASDVASR